MTTRTEPSLLDALALLAIVADEVPVDTVRDTHRPGSTACTVCSTGRSARRARSRVSAIA
ncbi:hypothetical protein [Nocardioides sp. B-3]|uniref:hypothetical protein n=1 Tax=Nocardioides sp. B-3 TaxID=2895565 RepID=UPI0021527F48|nr:hypothetical protein [Nocardioides sp. B-3]UUZ60039.1 hypothetical protein LP418_03265 [Nocardioides sp. B-3]